MIWPLTVEPAEGAGGIGGSDTLGAPGAPVVAEIGVGLGPEVMEGKAGAL